MIIMNVGPEELTAILGSHTTERGGSGDSMTDTTTGRGTDTMTTGEEMTGITREAAEADLAAEDTLTREGIPMRGDTTHTRPLPRTASVPGGEKVISKYVI